MSLELPNEEGDIETTSLEGMGTYSLSGSNYTMTSKEKHHFSVPEEPIDSDPEGTIENHEDTGTWSRKGNSLTLTSDDGTTIVFKKK